MANLKTDDESLNKKFNHAVEVGNIKTVKSLVRCIDINKPRQDELTPLCVASMYGHYKIVQFLIEKGASIDSTVPGPGGQRYTALYAAVDKNHVSCVKILLEYGARVFPETEHICHPIHIAVFKNYVDIADLLVNYGANVNLRFNNDFFNEFEHPMYPALWKYQNLPLLHYSILRKYDKMTDLLMSAGANVNMKTEKGKTTLMQAVEVNNVELVELLIRHYGANVNDREKTGKSVLHYTVLNANIVHLRLRETEYMNRHKKLEILKLLVEHGVDTNVYYPVGNKQHSPIHHMISAGYGEAVKYMINHSNFKFETLRFKSRKVRGRDREPEDQNPGVERHSEYCIGMNHQQKAIIRDIGKCAINRQLLGLPVHKSVISAIPLNGKINVECYWEDIDEYRDTSINMIKYMKEIELCGSNITFWRLMTCEMRELVNFMFNEKARCLDAFEECKHKFSRFAHIFENRLKIADRKKLILEKSIDNLLKLINHQLPYDFCRTIVFNLEDKEVHSLYLLSVLQ